jgi:hypothetical protein
MPHKLRNRRGGSGKMTRTLSTGREAHDLLPSDRATAIIHRNDDVHGESGARVAARRGFGSTDSWPGETCCARALSAG